MQGTSLNIIQDLISQLKQVIPQAITEDKIDFDMLKTLVGEGVISDNERYGLDWAGKSEAYKVLQVPTSCTLNPQPQDSINWDDTENVFIEGENLQVLKALQKSYYGKVKMIYIDPPYNTGSDSFIYPDKFSETKEEYLKRIGDKDEEGTLTKEGLFRKNSKENGQYHSNWLNMMLPRLFLARNLLKDDGIIFVSIDDNEQANLKLLMDEIFGAENFVACLVWQKKYGPANDAKSISSTHECILVYTKNLESWSPKLFERDEDQLKAFQNPDNDPRGIWRASDFSARTYSKSGDYPIIIPSGQTVYPPASRAWITNETRFKEMVEDNRIWFGVDGRARPMQKKFITEVKEGITPQTWWSRDFAGDNKTARYELKELFPENVFETPKPSTLIKRIIQVSNAGNNDIILDFFAGSGTTAHAVLELNEQDGENRKFICVQMPEIADENSEAKKAGFDTIANITQARIKKVIEKIENERNGTIELEKRQTLGFRKYTLEDSNFKIWRGDIATNVDELIQQMQLFTTPQRANAQSENMLWELLLKNGVSLAEKVQTVTLADGETIYYTHDKRLSVVLDSFSKAVLQELLQTKPKAVLMLDTLFKDRDNDKTNAQLQLEDNGISFKTI